MVGLYIFLQVEIVVIMLCVITFNKINPHADWRQELTSVYTKAASALRIASR